MMEELFGNRVAVGTFSTSSQELMEMLEAHQNVNDNDEEEDSWNGDSSQQSTSSASSTLQSPIPRQIPPRPTTGTSQSSTSTIGSAFYSPETRLTGTIAAPVPTASVGVHIAPARSQSPSLNTVSNAVVSAAPTSAVPSSTTSRRKRRAESENSSGFQILMQDYIRAQTSISIISGNEC